MQRKLVGLVGLNGFDRFVQLISILQIIGFTKEYRLINEGNYISFNGCKDKERFNDVHNFIMKNFTSKIKLETVASIAGLNKTAFCKYFKQKTNKSFSRFLNEVRVEHSCKLLLMEGRTIKEICEDSGFRNIANYNRQFKKITGKTPREYRVENTHEDQLFLVKNMFPFSEN